jgi:phage portal protein BeeE
MPGSSLVVGPAALAVNARTILGESVAHRCVQLIADAMGNAGWGEWRDTERLPTSRLVRRPAVRITRRNWAWRVAATMALWSWCPLLRVGDLDSEGVIGSLVPVLPDEVGYTPQGSWTYRGEDRGPDGVRPVYRDVWPGLDGQLAGVISLARETFVAAYSAASYDAAFWENGGAPKTLLTTEQVLSQDQADELRTRYVKARTEHPGEPAVLGRGLKLDAFGADLAAAGAGDAAGRLGAAVARYFGVPPHLANVPNYASSLTYVNTESAGIDLVRYTLSAYSGAIGDAVSEELPGQYDQGRRVVLDLSGLTVPDLESQGRYFQAALGKWLTRDEVRAQLNLPALPDSAFNLGAPDGAAGPPAAPAPLTVVGGSAA